MSCEDLLKFDVTAISSDYAAQYAAFSYVNQQNYEDMKQKYSASVPEYFRAPRKTSFPENPAYKNQRLTEPILQKSGVFRGALQWHL